MTTTADFPDIPDFLDRRTPTARQNVRPLDAIAADIHKVGRNSLRLTWGDYPDATLVALDDLDDWEPWHAEAVAALKARKPESDEEADAILAATRPPEPPAPSNEEVGPAARPSQHKCWHCTGRAGVLAGKVRQHSYPAYEGVDVWLHDSCVADFEAREAAAARDDIGPNSQGEVERLRSQIEDLKTALEKSASDRAESLYRALDPIKMAGLPITDQLIILVGLLFDGLAPIKELVAALRLPENASLKRQSQLEGLQAMTGVVFDWMSVVREQVAEIKCALDEYAEPKASESNHGGTGEIEASPAATVASPPSECDASDAEQADPFVLPGFLDRRVAS